MTREEMALSALKKVLVTIDESDMTKWEIKEYTFDVSTFTTQIKETIRCDLGNGSDFAIHFYSKKGEADASADAITLG